MHATNPKPTPRFIQRRTLTSLGRMATIGLAGAMVLLLGGAALYSQSGVTVPTYTGCLNPAGGNVTKLKIGSASLLPCQGPEITVQFSAGDITKISVTGGLTGGGDNGDITIGLDPKYSLPQSCPTDYVTKWNGTVWVCAADNDTTYLPSTGLDLLASPLRFAILEAYRLPQNCEDGAVALKQGTKWVCGSFPSSVFEVQSLGEQGIPDDGAPHTMVQTPLPPGTYSVVVKGAFVSDENVSDFKTAGCSVLSTGGVGSDETRLGSVVLDDIPEIPFALAAKIVLPTGGTMRVSCFADDGADGMRVEDLHLVATKVQ